MLESREEIRTSNKVRSHPSKPLYPSHHHNNASTMDGNLLSDTYFTTTNTSHVSIISHCAIHTQLLSCSNSIHQIRCTNSLMPLSTQCVFIYSDIRCYWVPTTQHYSK